MRLAESFFWGILAALGALVFEVVFSAGFSSSYFFTAPALIIIAATIEEIFKCLVIFRRVEVLSEQKMSSLQNSLFVGLGFFAAELALISTSSALPDPYLLIEIAIIHIGVAGIAGYIATVKNRKKTTNFLYATMIALFFHATYNLLNINKMILQNYLIFFLLGLLVFINVGIFLRKNSQHQQTSV